MQPRQTARLKQVIAFLQRHKFAVFAAIAALIVLLILLSGPTQKEKNKVNELTKDMRTHCIGRYLVDLPKDFEQTLNDYATLTYGLGTDFKTAEVEIISTGATPELFKAAVMKRRAEIASEWNRAANASMLAYEKEISSTQFLLRAYDSASLAQYHKIELHLLMGGTYVLLKADSFDNKFAPVEARLLKLATQISPFKDAIPTAKGYCLGNILINADHDQEQVDANFRDPQHPDLRLNISMNALTGTETPTLLGRSSESNPLYKILLTAGQTTLRKGVTKLGEMHAEEVLDRLKLEDRIRLQFRVEAIRPVPSFAQPALDIVLNLGEEDEGKRLSSSLTDYEAMGVWDAIIKSVRLRPGAL